MSSTVSKAMKQVSPPRLFEIFKRSGGSLLSLDVGNDDVGVARSKVLDDGNLTMVPIRDKTELKSTVLRRYAEREKYESPLLMKELSILVSKYSVSAIVVGCTLDRDGYTSKTAENYIHQFLKNLRNSGAFKTLFYAFWEENYTSACVDHLKLAGCTSNRQRKRTADQYAATLIGQDFLNTMETRFCPGASVEARGVWRMCLDNKTRCFPSRLQKSVSVPKFASLVHKLFMKNGKLVSNLKREELYQKIFMTSEFDTEDQVEKLFAKLNKRVSGLIIQWVDKDSGNSHYSLDGEKIELLKCLDGEKFELED